MKYLTKEGIEFLKEAKSDAKSDAELAAKRSKEARKARDAEIAKKAVDKTFHKAKLAGVKAKAKFQASNPTVQDLMNYKT